MVCWSRQTALWYLTNDSICSDKGVTERQASQQQHAQMNAYATMPNSSASTRHDGQAYIC